MFGIGLISTISLGLFLIISYSFKLFSCDTCFEDPSIATILMLIVLPSIFLSSPEISSISTATLSFFHLIIPILFMFFGTIINKKRNMIVWCACLFFFLVDLFFIVRNYPFFYTNPAIYLSTSCLLMLIFQRKKFGFIK
jgi:hypothetical protein